MKDVLPPELMTTIGDHLRSGVSTAEEGFAQASADEDVVTGALGERLRTTGEWVEGTYNNQRCRWRVRYKKFRGRGPGAAETRLGADWLIDVEVENMATGGGVKKGLLAQSKMSGKGHDYEQYKKMEEVTPGRSAVFDYGESGYFAEPSSEAIANKGRHANNREGRKGLGELLGSDFLECRIGQRGLYYDAIRSILLLPTTSDELRIVHFNLKQRLSIDVQTNVE